MRIVRAERRPGELPRGAVATIGNYDGVHRGQQAILAAVVARAHTLGVEAAVVTFDPHPAELLRPQAAPPRITGPRQRERLLAACGIDELWIVPFTLEFAALDAELFVSEVLAAGLGPSELHVGSRFQFGRDRAGDLACLQRLGSRHGFQVFGHPELRLGEGAISSTRVREAVGRGDLAEASKLLGRPFAVAGPVVRGDRVGHQLGWPTANVEPEGSLLPLDGVYVTSATLPDSGAEELPGVTNVGRRPTRDGSGLCRVEAHLFDFDREVYGSDLELAFLSRLRDERRFSSLDELQAQIALDVEAGREYFARRAGFQGQTAPDG